MIRRAIQLFAIIYFSLCVCPGLALSEANRSSAILGTVLSDNGDVLSGYVTAFRLGISGGTITPTVESTAKIERGGAFQCLHLIAGTYVLGINIVTDSIEENYVSTKETINHAKAMVVFYPESSDLDPTSLVKLTADTTQWESILADTSTSEIQVTPVHSVSKTHVRITLQGQGFSIPFNAPIQINLPNGDLLFGGLPPGRYSIIEEWNAGGEERDATAVTTVDQSEESHISLEERKYTDITGSITFDDYAPTGEPEVVLQPLFGDGMPQRLAVRRDGSFSAKQVPEGAYSISFNLGSGLYASDLQVDGRDAQVANFSVGYNIPQPVFTVTTQHAEGIISGDLEECGPKHAIVIRDVSAHISHIVHVNDGGTFKVHGLPPGAYWIYGFANIDDIPYNNASFLARLRDVAIQLNVDGDSVFEGLDVECSQASL